MRFTKLLPAILFTIIMIGISFPPANADEDNKATCDYNSLDKPKFSENQKVFLEKQEWFVNHCLKDPKAGDVWFSLILLYYEKLKDHDKAMFYAKQFVQRFPKSAWVDDVYVLMGLMSYETGSFEDAIKYYKLSIENDPLKWGSGDSDEPFNNDIPGKIKFIRENSDCEQKPLKIFSGAQRESSVTQIAAYKQILEKYADCKIARLTLFNLAQLYEKLRIYNSAMATYKKYLQKYPAGEDTAQAQLKLLSFYGNAGDETNFLDEYKKFVHMFPASSKDPQVLQVLSSI